MEQEAASAPGFTPASSSVLPQEDEKKQTLLLLVYFRGRGSPPC